MPTGRGAVRGERVERDPLAALRRAGGDARAKPQGGDRLSHKTEAHAGLIHAALDELPDIPCRS